MECSIGTSLKSDLVAVWRPLRCYCLNVELNAFKGPIRKAFTHQLHITDNFTLVESEFREFLDCGVLARGFSRSKDLF